MISQKAKQLKNGTKMLIDDTKVPGPTVLDNMMNEMWIMRGTENIWKSFLKINKITFHIDLARNKKKGRQYMTKAAFNNKKTFHQQTGLKFKEETSKVLHLERSFVWC
jgi:hypothetical protein